MQEETEMAAYLTGGRVNLTLFRDEARKELLNCLDKCPGSKVRCIIIYVEPTKFRNLVFLV